jgi:hypothetical protein
MFAQRIEQRGHPSVARFSVLACQPALRYEINVRTDWSYKNPKGCFSDANISRKNSISAVSVTGKSTHCIEYNSEKKNIYIYICLQSFNYNPYFAERMKSCSSWPVSRLRNIKRRSCEVPANLRCLLRLSSEEIPLGTVLLIELFGITLGPQFCFRVQFHCSYGKNYAINSSFVLAKIIQEICSWNSRSVC